MQRDPRIPEKIGIVNHNTREEKHLKSTRQKCATICFVHFYCTVIVAKKLSALTDSSLSRESFGGKQAAAEKAYSVSTKLL